jgi:hypothetical protein
MHIVSSFLIEKGIVRRHTWTQVALANGVVTSPERLVVAADAPLPAAGSWTAKLASLVYSSNLCL